MSHRFPPCTPGAQALSRRRFVQGIALGGIAASGLPTLAQARASQLPLAGQPLVLAGPELDLSIGQSLVNYTGRARRAITVNGSLPAPILRFREGDDLTIRVHNTLDVDTSIHWHGILLPANMDGVPGFSFHGIHPGETFTYRYRLLQNGTYWYHSHSGAQEQVGLYGAMIVEPRDAAPKTWDREHVILFSDWTDLDPHRLLARLKKSAHYYNRRKLTVPDFFADAREHGWAATLEDRKGWGRMRMSPSDLADVNGFEYTYLANGMTPASNWTGLFTPGERVLLRLINGSAMSYFDLRIPGLKLTVIAADGQPVEPVSVDEIRLAVAETYDVIVEPAEERAYTIFAQNYDRSGYARATLAPRAGMEAAIPDLDKPVYLTMADMGHDHGAHGDHAQMSHAADPHAGHDMHAGHAGHEGHAMSGMTMPSHPASETDNPHVDMQTMMPAPKLDDPGIGLRDNGRDTLTYSQLRSTFHDPDGREPSRTIELHLTGHMERFSWSFDGIKFSSAEPLRLIYGERVRIVLVNDTMMEHPIHLHGLWSDLEDEAGQFLVRKHTITIPPGTRRSFRVTADALGRWAFHCHLLYHMETGMFREVRVEESA
ncbi:copper resistance system multicopper oxidase [Xanthomonadaceae bacterium XH05]|nr:copper resistance system multicopper oxidase [Xanthomonadaceae bacterium XH05]